MIEKINAIDATLSLQRFLLVQEKLYEIVNALSDINLFFSLLLVELFKSFLITSFQRLFDTDTPKVMIIARL